jgi:mono/diheme cytochrome c family protein
MLTLKPSAEAGIRNANGKNMKRAIFYFLLFALAFSSACRYDMQDQPRYKVFKKSDFFADKRSSRDFPSGTVARGNLREDKALYTGKKENADPNVQVQTTTDPSGNTLITSFPNDIEEFPIPVTKELLDRGQQRYNVFCGVCHGPFGNGDGMIVRRGFPKPPTYNDDRLRNAPVGHFFDVITNGQGRMSAYASQIPVADRWAIVMYIRALQRSQNPAAANPLTQKEPNMANETPKPAESPKPATQGGAK